MVAFSLLLLLARNLLIVAQTEPQAGTRDVVKSEKAAREFSQQITSRALPADFKSLGRELLESRAPGTYARAQTYAASHAGSVGGGLAWLAIGYSRALDHDYPKAISALKQARPLVGPLADYVDYFLATSYAAMGRNDAAVSTLRGFDSNHSESLFIRDAAVIDGSALLAQGQPIAAIAILERHRQPIRPDLELALGRAYIAAGEPILAGEALRNIYFGMPTAPEAADAREALNQLPASVPAPSGPERKARADRLLQAHAYNEAVKEYRNLLPAATPDDAAEIQLSLAEALYHNHQSAEAMQVLALVSSSRPDQRQRRLCELIEIARANHNESEIEQFISELREQRGGGKWFEEGLLSAANMYLLEGDYARAIALYRDMGQDPDSTHAHYGHWRATWLNLRQHGVNAKGDLEEQVMLYPRSPEVPSALYWLGRLEETQQDLPRAKAYYQKIVDRFPGYYYAELSRRRLKTFRPQTDAVYLPVIEKIPPASFSFAENILEVPSKDLRVQKALLLQNGGFTKFAVRELQALATASGSPPPWLISKIVDFYDDAGRYDQAMETIKHLIPDYFAIDLTDLPQSYWRALFPLVYWDDLQRYSHACGLDPFLVAALIRQESEFNPYAVSRANALGLMQLLPTTGLQLARELHLPIRSRAQLLTPKTNLQLGTHLFRKLLDDYDGHAEYALAAYNAGAARVQEWRSQGHFEDEPDFVESIPFSETREYVQAVLRNANMYRRLYERR